MSADDDTELRDLVIDSLEKKGVLGKIKAELRATVFLALEENEKDSSVGGGHAGSQVQLELRKFLETRQGLLALSLVTDFLEQFQLNFSLAVLEPEAASPQKCLPRKELCDLLKLTPGKNTHWPLLCLLLANGAASAPSNVTGDLPASVPQNSKGAPVQGALFEKSAFGSDLLTSRPLSEKQHPEKQPKQPEASPLPGDDPFFDDQLATPRTHSTFYNFLDNKPALSKAADGGKELFGNRLESLDLNHGRVQSGPFLLLEPETKSSFPLSSLRNLPSLINEPARPKESGRKLWKETEPEQKERILNLTFGSKQNIEDDLLSPTSSGSEIERKTAREEEALPKDGASLEADGAGSIEEDIEEDLSALADDASSSSKDENFTVDKSVSGFSKAGGYDYIEKLS